MHLKRRIPFLSVFLIALFIFSPFIPAVELDLVHSAVDQNIKQTIEDKLGQHDRSLLLPSVLLKQITRLILLFIQAGIIVNISVFLVSFFELFLLPLALELHLGWVMFVLLMILSLWIPIQLITGFCLLIQKQYQFTSDQTRLLTVFLLLVTFSRIILQ